MRVAIAYSKTLCDALISKKNLCISGKAESDLLQKLSAATDGCYEKCEALRMALNSVPGNSEDASIYYHDVIVTIMQDLRKDADILEQLTDKSYWPYPTYSDLLYY